jgi:hypothetical protein
MTPADVQSIINCINQLNRAIDYKHWEKLGDLLEIDLVVSFPSSSISPNSRVGSNVFQKHLVSQLSNVNSFHRDYNFFLKSNETIVCKTDFKIEVYSETNVLLSSASGVHLYEMSNESGRWKIAGIQRKILRVDAPKSTQGAKDYSLV